MRRVFEGFPLIHLLSTTGDPPEKYVIEYRVRGLAPGTGAEPSVREQHRVEITLTTGFPREAPRCRTLTPVFHPQIWEIIISTDDHWDDLHPGNTRLIDIVILIGRMIAYQEYNIRSPMDGEAAMWIELNSSRLPIDTRDLHPPNCE